MDQWRALEALELEVTTNEPFRVISIQPVLYTDSGSFLSKNVYYLYHLYWGHCSAFPLIHTSLSLKTFCILAPALLFTGNDLP